MFKETLIGVVVAIIATTFGTLLATSFFSDLPILEAVELMYKKDLLLKVMTIGAIGNLVAFFLFLKREQEFRARGVLFVTICIAIGMVILNIF